MFTIGETISVHDVPITQDTSLVTNKVESAIVREFTFEELLYNRQVRPELLGPFAFLSSDELHHELDEYESFLVETGSDDYNLVIGFTGTVAQPCKGPTILYTVPQGYRASAQGLLYEGGKGN